MNVFLGTLILLSAWGCSLVSSPTANPLKKDPTKPIVDPVPDFEDKESCQEFLVNPKYAIQESPRPSSEFAARRWLNRASRKLRNQRGLTEQEWQVLKNKPRSEVVESWMDDPGFADTSLDFNMYHWGWKKDSLRDSAGNFTSEIYDIPNGISAAQALNPGPQNTTTKDLGYFERLFSATPPLFGSSPTSPFEMTELPPPGSPLPTPRSPREIRETIKEATHQDLLSFMKTMKENPPASNEDFCFQFRKTLLESDHLQRLFNFGFQDLINLGMLSFEQDWYVPQACFGKPPIEEKIDPQALLSRIDERNEFAMTRAIDWIDQVSDWKQISQIQPFDPEYFGLRKITPLPFGPKLKLALPNSSTNMNRKRANFVLERFFCDSLVPINVENPSGHSGNRHASETSCRACHYKLDPMAGFFANYGAGFLSFAKEPKLVFDDGADVDREEYLKNWIDPDTNRPQIGYVRSLTHPEENYYGSSLEDLFSILRKAPEVKRCLTQRLFEFVVAPEQSIDSGYLNFVSKEFRCLAEKDSTLAYKRVFKRMILSESFNQDDLDSTQCYDFAPGEKQEGAPPCQVNFLLQKNCLVCHSSTTSLGRIDLSQWKSFDSGKSSFPHLDAQGKQVSRIQTLQSLAEVLSTTDPTRRMPKDRFISPSDRENIFNWVNQQLELNEGKEK